MIVGYFIVTAEPAVHVLNKQVRRNHQRRDFAACDASEPFYRRGGFHRSFNGACSHRFPSFWFLVPGYALALGLMFVVPKMFTAIAFDSGGVASGPMTATFLLPFAMGACESLGGDVLMDAFGIVAMVAMTPLI